MAKSLFKVCGLCSTAIPRDEVVEVAGFKGEVFCLGCTLQILAAQDRVRDYQPRKRRGKENRGPFGL